MKNKSHILFERNFDKNPYKTPKNNPISVPPITRDRTYGNYLLEKIEKIKEKFDIQEIKNPDFVKEFSLYRICI